ncbi:kinase-like domain-containing protein [Trametes gibbosa]|nr:kinase-like domain-containing protein [Trametes gibbosa]
MSAGIAGSSYDPGTLTSEEVVWSRVQLYLEEHGYLLRPRYRQGWIPSWRGQEPGAWARAEDGLTLPARVNVIDAIRIADNSLVYIKKVRADGDEQAIVAHLNTVELRQDARNRSVPILDTLPHPDEGSRFIVMPFLRYIDSPDFACVEEILYCGEQLLEGLVFLHENHIAHRDCAYKNIMMDASGLYPRGFHPILQDDLPDITARAPVLSRTSANIRYYFTDFGISSRFSAQDDNRFVVGREGLDKSVPELSNDVPYDPFKVDVYILGNVFKGQFLEKYKNFGFLEPLVLKMTARDPALRPSAETALQEWRALYRRTSVLNRFRRVEHVDATLGARLAVYASYPFLYIWLVLAFMRRRLPHPPAL